MDPLFTQFEKAKREVHLSAEQKEKMRGNLLRLVQADLDVRARSGVRHTWQRSSLLTTFKNMPIAAALMVMVLLGGGTSFAAERSLPGDPLYSVKVHVNEPIVGALSLSPDAKVNWEVELADRRLTEATQLAESGKLDSKTQAELSTEFRTHQEKTEKVIKEREDRGDEEGAASLASRFEGSLKTQGQILGDVDGQATGTEVASLRTTVSDALAVATEARVRLEAKIKSENGSSTARAAKEKIRVASKVVVEAQNYFEKKKGDANQEVTLNAEAQLKLSNDLVLQAQAKNDAQLYGEAFNLANQAIQTAQDSRALIRIREDLRARANVHDKSDSKGKSDDSASSSVSSTDRDDQEGSDSEKPSSSVSVHEDLDVRGEVGHSTSSRTQIEIQEKGSGGIKLPLGL